MPTIKYPKNPNSETAFVNGNDGTAIGYNANAGASGVSIGSLCHGINNNTVVIGKGCEVYGTYNTAIGTGCGGNLSTTRGIAIGANSRIGADYAIQIGSTGSNTTNLDANTFKVGNANGNFELMNANGNLPADRLASTTGLADGNYRLRLTMASGVPTLSWVAE